MNSPQQRAALILQVRSGQLTARAAARQLGLSRQRYYQWEKRALQAMLLALKPKARGRPKAATDPEKQDLQRRVRTLEKQVQAHEQKERLRARLKQLEARPAGRAS